jgi:hypothetical protein
MNKKGRFYLAKALIFGLICVIANFYIPKYGLHEVKEYQQDAKYSAEFNQVNAIYHFKASSEINALNQKAAELIKAKNPKSEIKIEDPVILFRIWALSHRNMPGQSSHSVRSNMNNHITALTRRNLSVRLD